MDERFNEGFVLVLSECYISKVRIWKNKGAWIINSSMHYDGDFAKFVKRHMVQLELECVNSFKMELEDINEYKFKHYAIDKEGNRIDFSWQV